MIKIKGVALAMIMVPALLTSCSEEVDGVADASCRRTITANAGMGSPLSRSAIDPTEYQNGAVGILWTPEDVIGVFSDHEELNVEFKNRSAYTQGRSQFEGSMRGKPVHAYYPYTAENAGCSAEELKGTLQLTQTYDESTGRISGDWKRGTPRDGADGEFDFTHIFSLLKISVSASGTDLEGQSLREVVLELPEGRTLGGDFTFNAITGEYTMTSSDGANVITLEWNGEGTLDSNKTLTGYISCAPDIKENDELTIKVVTDKQVASFTAHAAYNFEAGTIYNFDLNLPELAKKYNIKYEDVPVEEEEETANCYMITMAGAHDFKATVIGNGAKGIIKGAGFHTEDARIDPKSAKLIWEDTKGFVTDVKLEAGRVHYTTSGDTGNALIAVYSEADGKGEVLWSWHIWGVGPELPGDEEITNYNGAVFSVMDRTLGSHIYNPNKLMLYQWGRKDPIPNDTILWVNGVETEISTSDYHYYNVRNFTSTDDNEATIEMSIKNPTCFFNRSKNLSSGNWLNEEILSLWGNSQYADVQKQNPTKQSDFKTIYDPSPVGYRVANCQTFSGFSKHEGGSNASVGNYRAEWINYVKYDHGYYFMRNSEDVEGTLFPMSGSRGGYYGMSHSSTGNGNKKKYYWNGDRVGYYWYSNPAPSTAGKAVHLDLTQYVEFNTGSTVINSNNKITCYNTSDRSVAMAVRCVRE